MQVLFAVLNDLFQFAVQSLFGVRTLRVEDTIRYSLPPRAESALLTKTISPAPVIALATNQQRAQYVCAADAVVCVEPVQAYDVAIHAVPYGSLVAVVQYQGRWAYVETANGAGWMLKDQLTPHVADVYPSFLSGAVYHAQHPSTVKLRACLQDEFFGGAAGLPLTAAEYVTYRWWQTNRVIAWPSTRPRQPGRWQSLLRGNSSVYLGIVPKTGAVMEWTGDELGHLAYVEAVFPDERIRLSMVGQTVEGEYTELVLPTAEWRELRPVFIAVQ